jgi:hypothetical protein
MTQVSLRSFVNSALAKSGITVEDVSTLQCEILPDGLQSRDDVALLLDLDRRLGSGNAVWAAWLVAAIVDFVVWGERPTGYVEEATGRWLEGVLAGAGVPAPSMPLIAREIRREAHGMAPDLLSCDWADEAVEVSRGVAALAA